MFTGIIEEIGTLASATAAGGGKRFDIVAPHSAKELQINDSIAINGACHTVVARRNDIFVVDSVEETLKKTTFGRLKAGDKVNLELPLRLQERLDGHLVMGHVDGVGTISDIETRETSWMFRIAIPEEFMRYLIPTGSVAIDGVSLTVAELEERSIRVSIIPHTMGNTIFPRYKANDPVNLEFDMVGKYIERMMGGSIGGNKKYFRLTIEQLREMGF